MDGRRRNNQSIVTPDYLMRVSVIGDEGVGKGALIKRGSNSSFVFNEAYDRTFGSELYSLTTTDFDGKIAKMQIMEIVYNESISETFFRYFKDTQVFMFVCDLTNKKSFEEMSRYLDFLTGIKKNSDNDATIFLIGTKADLAEKRQVSEEEFKEFAKNFDYSIETSAKTGKGVMQVFQRAANYNYFIARADETVFELLKIFNEYQSYLQTEKKNETLTDRKNALKQWFLECVEDMSKKGEIGIDSKMKEALIRDIKGSHLSKNKTFDDQLDDLCEKCYDKLKVLDKFKDVTFENFRKNTLQNFEKDHHLNKKITTISSIKGILTDGDKEIPSQQKLKKLENYITDHHEDINHLNKRRGNSKFWKVIDMIKAMIAKKMGKEVKASTIGVTGTKVTDSLYAYFSQSGKESVAKTSESSKPGAGNDSTKSKRS